MNSISTQFDLTSSALKLRACPIPWDIAAFGAPVVQVHTIEVIDYAIALTEYSRFRQWLETEDVRIVSCRLPHDRLRESMFLEANDFRFVEMVLHPCISNLQSLDLPTDHLVIKPAEESDVDALAKIAEDSFQHERYHVDFRIDSRIADLRYARWVRNSFGDPDQRLLKVMDGDRLLAVFIVEFNNEASVYWHLTAVAPEWQGRGYGRRIWQAMLRYHQAEGCESLTTTISARNVAVLNLYAWLGSRFYPPEMTFHWIREEF